MLICVILSLTQWKFEKGKICVELSCQGKFHCLGKDETEKGRKYGRKCGQLARKDSVSSQIN